METLQMTAQNRSEFGKGAARRLRRTGMIPVNAYQGGEAPASLQINPKDLEKITKQTGRNSVINVQVDGASDFTCMIKELQRHPVTGNLMHADLLQIDTSKPVRVKVNVNFNGRPVGALRGGKVEVFRRRVELIAVPADIPLFVNVDVSPLDVGEAVRVSDLPLPEGASYLPEHANIRMYNIAAPKTGPKKKGEE